MVAFLCSRDNVAFLKFHLRQDFPQIKSSHLTEAIAFGLGFNTHAALLNAASAMYPEVVHPDQEQFLSRLTELGYTTLQPELMSVDRSRLLPDLLWVEIPRGDIPSADSWFYECRDRQIPTVRIDRHGEFRDVDWDCISLSKGRDHLYDGDEGANIASIMFNFYKSMERFGLDGSEFVGSAFVGSIFNLNEKVAKNIADGIFMILYGILRSNIEKYS